MVSSHQRCVGFFFFKQCFFERRSSKRRSFRSLACPEKKVVCFVFGFWFLVFAFCFCVVAVDFYFSLLRALTHSWAQPAPPPLVWMKTRLTTASRSSASRL
jgi:hypothetical protein